MRQLFPARGLTDTELRRRLRRPVGDIRITVYDFAPCHEGTITNGIVDGHEINRRTAVTWFPWQKMAAQFNALAESIQGQLFAGMRDATKAFAKLAEAMPKDFR